MRTDDTRRSPNTESYQTTGETVGCTAGLPRSKQEGRETVWVALARVRKWAIPTDDPRTRAGRHVQDARGTACKSLVLAGVPHNCRSANRNNSREERRDEDSPLRTTSSWIRGRGCPGPEPGSTHSYRAVLDKMSPAAADAIRHSTVERTPKSAFERGSPTGTEPIGSSESSRLRWSRGSTAPILTSGALERNR